MMRSRSIAVTACVACFMAASVPVLTQQNASAQGPPVPFEDVGACPFEGCVYREWTAKAAVGVYDIQPSRCAGKIIERSQTEWWVQVRSRVGTIGWTHEPEKFDAKTAIGG